MTYQVKFTTSEDPTNPEGIVLGYEDVGGLVQEPNAVAVTFKSKFELDAAFLAAGIYLRDYSHLDPTENALPDPDKL
jgi:hypothetical protein